MALPAVMAAAALLGLSLGDARGDSSPSATRAATGTDRPELPGPAPRPRGPGGLRAMRDMSRDTPRDALRDAPSDVQKVNDECASCHGEIADEWRASLHRQAWTDPVFQKAYAIEPVAFCRSCHAPEARPSVEPGRAEQAVGVGCTTCHVQGDRITGPRDGSTAGAPHAVFGDARLATRQACEACHQFNFPGEKFPMQDTVREHAASSFAATECQACHMPAVLPKKLGGRPHKSHAFSVLGDPSMIRRAASVSAARDGARKVNVTIAPAGAGHAFPTGDMFRRLEIRAEAIDASGRTVARADPVFLGRTFTDRPRDREASLAFHRTEASDTRVPPPGAGAAPVVTLQFAQPTGPARVRWSVVYQRMGTAMAASFGVDQAIDEVVVAEGELPPFGGSF